MLNKCSIFAVDICKRRLFAEKQYVYLNFSLMEKSRQLARINEFIDELSKVESKNAVVLLDSEMDVFGADESTLGKQNGGDCRNYETGSCKSNGGNCTNYGAPCVNSTNSKNCINFSTVSGEGCKVE